MTTLQAPAIGQGPYQTTAETLPEEKVRSYRENGFVHVPGIISKEEAAYFREVALEIGEANKKPGGSRIFNQVVNLWHRDERMRKLTFHPNVTAVAKKLAGAPLRLWHDQILIKDPHNNAATEFHQDQPYWPHAHSPDPISIWIALCDVPVERGCMSFLPGTQKRDDLRMQNLGDKRSLFTICPDMEYAPRVTVPLRAGDCTFHHGRCAHMANPNETDEPRVAVTVIFMEDGTTYTGAGHVVTDPLKLEKGSKLEGDMFPLV